MPAYPNQKLGQLAHIRNGYSLRTAPVQARDGNLRFIQIKDIDPASNQIELASLVRIQLNNIKPDHLLQPGDILLRARGENRQAALFDLHEPACLAAPQFLIIRTQHQSVMPEYIYWYLNQIPAQSHFGKQANGTNIPHLKADALADLPVPIPPLEKQRIITALHRAVAKEQRLLQEKLANSRAMLNTIARQLLSGEQT